MSRHTCTGRRYAASSCQATGATLMPAAVAGERGAGEQQHQRDLAAVGQCVEVLGAGDLHVVRARAPRGRPRSSRRTRRPSCHVRPQERPQRLAPPRRVAEQLDESFLLGRLVAPALRLDADLALQGDGMHRLAGGVPSMRRRSRSSAARRTARPRRRRPRTTGSVTNGLPEPGRGRRTPRVRRAPRCRRRSPPQPAELADELVARVDRHQEALGLVGRPVDPDEERFDVGAHRRPARVGAATISSHASSGSSDSVAPPGSGRTRRPGRAWS